MMPILATLPAPDSYAAIGWICVGIAAVAFGANQIAEFWRNVKDKPTGAEILEKARKEFQPKGDYVSRNEFTTFQSGLEKDFKVISDENQTILTAGNNRETNLSNLINGLQGQINGLGSKIVADILNAKKLFKND